jgi:hypothetical protein
LYAGVDARVAVSERGAGDVNGVGAEVDGTARVNEVVDADAALGSEVPDAGVGVGTVVLLVVWRAAEGRVFVVRPEKAASGLAPVREVLCAGKIPAKDSRGNGHSGEGTADGIRRRADRWCAWGVGAEFALEFGRVRLPEGEGFDGKLEVAAERAVAVTGEDNFSNVNSCHEEFEAVAVFSEAVAALDEDANFKRQVIGVDMKRGDVTISNSLAGGKSGRQQECEEPDGRYSNASRAVDQSRGSGCLLTEEGRR